ncbi:PKD domain containing protein [Halorhabdus utahensis DSM 12940]|uniref:PKD domain containing protein n=1 Tax=Halorhabdus utahensis (strain DSM 12940 / JCM 11049 / AX-2) TaxID=519442 RepID=C7NVN6_HALUD|nr:PKD domain-containing protein [Halorhabdus utahensis]ACV12559.1 PKD domain containing protein [Halorhabdus utahensis DSM 12940]
MTDNNTQSTTQADRQQTTTDRESGRSGDASSSDGLESPARRDVLKAIGSGALIGVLGTGSASADPATFGDGVNLQPSYFCDGDQALGWDLMNDHPDIETVRIEIEPFSFDEVATTVEDAKRWIDEAAANGKNVIATYHHYPDNGSAEASALQDAADFWVEHYETLAADTDFTVNLMNEWGNHDVTAEEYASAYNDAISTVRSGTSYDGPIVCDAPGWGQGTYRLADAVESIDHDDLILSAHVYPSAWNATTGQNLVPEDLDVLDETGYPCMIGEFGNYADSTGADWSAIIDYAKELGWPVIGWAWNGDGSDDPMNMANPYWGDDCGAESYTASEYFDVVYDKLGDSAGGGGGSDDGDDGTDDGGDGTDDGGDTGEGSDGQDDGDGGTTVDLLAEIRPSTTDAGVGERLTFSVTDTSGTDRWIDALSWDFDDGDTASGWWAEHTYDSAGTYTVSLTATDNEGDSTTHQVDIVVGGDDGADDGGGGESDGDDSESSDESGSGGSSDDQAGEDGGDSTGDVLAEITPSTTDAAVGERLTFSVTDTSGNSRWIESLSWDFDDGDTATGWWTEHTYDATGTYTVALTATDNEGESTTHEVTITVS